MLISKKQAGYKTTFKWEIRPNLERNAYYFNFYMGTAWVDKMYLPAFTLPLPAACVTKHDIRDLMSEFWMCVGGTSSVGKTTHTSKLCTKSGQMVRSLKVMARWLMIWIFEDLFYCWPRMLKQLAACELDNTDRGKASLVFDEKDLLSAPAMKEWLLPSLQGHYLKNSSSIISCTHKPLVVMNELIS